MFASLLVSVLLVGFKMNGAKEIVQIIERRKELTTYLALLQRLLEHEDKDAWIADVTHDTKEREDRISELGSASGLSYSTSEKDLIEKGMGMFSVFERSSAGVKQLAHSATITCLETKLDEATGLLLGQAAAMIRATPQEIVTYTLNYCDSRVGRSFVAADPNTVRFESLERVHAWHTIVFTRVSAAGMRDRTFLNAIVAKRVAEDPPMYVCVVVPIPSHEKISPKDEARAVRGENFRSFRLTEVAPGATRLEYCCSLDLKGWVPQIVTNTIAVPQQTNGV